MQEKTLTTNKLYSVRTAAFVDDIIGWTFKIDGIPVKHLEGENGARN